MFFLFASNLFFAVESPATKLGALARGSRVDGTFGYTICAADLWDREMAIGVGGSVSIDESGFLSDESDFYGSLFYQCVPTA